MKGGIPRNSLSGPVEKKGSRRKQLHPHPKLSLSVVPIGLSTL